MSTKCTQCNRCKQKGTKTITRTMVIIAEYGNRTVTKRFQIFYENGFRSFMRMVLDVL